MDIPFASTETWSRAPWVNAYERKPLFTAFRKWLNHHDVKSTSDVLNAQVGKVIDRAQRRSAMRLAKG